MFQSFESRPTPVRAMRFDGDHAKAQEVTQAEVGREVDMPVLQPGMWLLVDDMGSVTGLPDSVFQRCYQTSDPDVVTLSGQGFRAPAGRSCFDCVSFMNAPILGSYCQQFSERIDSELTTAQRCDEYEEAQP